MFNLRFLCVGCFHCSILILGNGPLYFVISFSFGALCMHCKFAVAFVVRQGSFQQLPNNIAARDMLFLSLLQSLRPHRKLVHERERLQVRHAILQQSFDGKSNERRAGQAAAVRESDRWSGTVSLHRSRAVSAGEKQGKRTLQSRYQKPCSTRCKASFIYKFCCGLGCVNWRWRKFHLNFFSLPPVSTSSHLPFDLQANFRKRWSVTRRRSNVTLTTQLSTPTEPRAIWNYLSSAWRWKTATNASRRILPSVNAFIMAWGCVPWNRRKHVRKYCRLF